VASEAMIIAKGLIKEAGVQKKNIDEEV